MSKKGRKVYRTNSYEKKKRLKRALRILLGLIVIAALVFVGYSVGKPILNYLNKENENTDNVEEPWTPPAVTSWVTETLDTSGDSTEVTVEPSETVTSPDNKINSSGLTA